MLTYKNETDKDVKATIRPADPKALPTEIIIKAGETYDVPAEIESEFLRWMMDAKTQGADTPDNKNESKNQDNDTENNEVNEDVDATDQDGDSDNNGKKVAETEVVKNDRDFDIEINYQEGGETKKVTVKAGSDITVPKDQADTVKKQIAEAENSSDNTKEEKTEKDDELAEERQALAEERAKLAEERAELEFSKLCESGKVVPAQKKAFMALATAQGEVALAEGDAKHVSELLADFIQSAPKHSLMEEEGKSGEGEDGVELTDEDKQVAAMFGNSEEDIKKTRKDA